MPVVATAIWYELLGLNGQGQSTLELKVVSYSRTAAQYQWMPVVATSIWYELGVLNGWGQRAKFAPTLGPTFPYP